MWAYEFDCPVGWVNQLSEMGWSGSEEAYYLDLTLSVWQFDADQLGSLFPSWDIASSQGIMYSSLFELLMACDISRNEKNIYSQQISDKSITCIGCTQIIM